MNMWSVLNANDRLWLIYRTPGLRDIYRLTKGGKFYQTHQAISDAQYEAWLGEGGWTEVSA